MTRKHAGKTALLGSLSSAAGVTLLMAAACGGDSNVATPNEPEPQPADSSFTSTGTIAFARGGEIRLVEPDGSAEHSIWTAPSGAGFTVSGIGWRPNGGSLAFSSDHEMATSFYERDIYTVLPDGNHLRKLTNGPTHAELAGYPKGTVQVTVQNNTGDGGPYVIYAVGAAEPQSALIAPGNSTTLTFPNVADLGGFEGRDSWSSLPAEGWSTSALRDQPGGATGRMSVLSPAPLPAHWRRSPRMHQPAVLAIGLIERSAADISWTEGL